MSQKKSKNTIKQCFREELEIKKLMTYFFGYIIGLFTLKYSKSGTEPLLFWAIVFPLGLIFYINLKVYLRIKRSN
jgi:hypothetical protein